MRFETAIAAVLAAESLSSSSVAAQEDLSGRSIQERALLREEAVKAFSNKYRGDHRSLQRAKEKKPWRHLNADRLRKLSERSLENLKASVKQEQQKQQRQLAKKDDSSSGSDSLDLGILPSDPAKIELKKKLLSNIEKIQQKTKATSNPGANSKDVAPDLGVLPTISTKGKNNGLADKMKKLAEVAIPKSRKESNGKIQTNAKFSRFVDDRRLEEYPDFIFDAIGDNLDAPLAYLVRQVCVGAIQYCDACEVNFVDENNALAGYSVNMKCVAPEGYRDDANEILTGFSGLCTYGLCETKCDVDVDNFVVDMRGCSVTNIDGLQEDLANVEFPSNDGDQIDNGGFGDFGDFLDGSFDNILATSLGYTCDLLESVEAFNDGEAPFCNTCKVTYLPANGDVTPYNIEIDCPNLPEEEDDNIVDSFSGFDTLCSYGICESCDIDSEDFKIDLKNCSFAFAGDLLGNIDGDLLDSYLQDSTGLGAYSQAFFNEYFDPLCNSDDIICGSCGSKPEDDSVFSFQLDCPSVLGAPDKLFGDFFYYPTIFCFKPEILGLQCGTCEVDPFQGRVDIGDCVPLTEDEIEASSIGDIDIADVSDEVAFFTLYSETCRELGEGYSQPFLQYIIDEPDCTCAFDASTKTASIVCQHENNCRDFPSYCEGTLEFCDAYVDTVSIVKDEPMNIQRCFTISSGPPNDDMFTYCLTFSMRNDVVNGTASQSIPGCDMEVEGVRCNSCSLRYSGLEGLSILPFMDSDVYYDCKNSVIGANGNGNLSDSQLVEDTFQYFIYNTLPCPGGCDLCGSGDGKKSTFMTKPDGVFATEKWKDNMQDRCFDAQLDAMSLKQQLTNEECQQMRDIVREPCGCKNPNPPPPGSSSGNSIGNRFSTMNSILLTFAAASLVQIFIG